MENSEVRILIADDEPDIIEFIGYNLKKEGFQVFEATNGLEAEVLVKEIQPHLLLLDIMMPGLDGVELCRRLRTDPKNKDLLIAFLTARMEDYSQITALEVGGDDYITKPIKPRILISRIKALLRRSERLNAESETLIKVSDFIIDKEKYLVFRGEEEIQLPKKEFELLCLLVSKPGKVFARDEIFNKIWGTDVIVGNRTIDVHIRKIREKIGESFIKTIKGIGYKFEF